MQVEHGWSVCIRACVCVRVCVVVLGEEEEQTKVDIRAIES